MSDEFKDKADDILRDLKPAIMNLLQIKNRSLGDWKLHIDATYADIIKTIWLGTGCEFDSESEYIKK